MKKYILYFSFYLLTINCVCSQPFVISGTIDSKETDTITLTWWNEFFTTQQMYNVPFARVQNITENGSFKIETGSLKHPVYFTLSRGTNPSRVFSSLLFLYIAYPGDSINVSIKEGVIKYTGKNAMFFKCQNALRETAKVVQNEIRKNRFTHDSSKLIRYYKNLFDESAAIYQAENSVLSFYEKSLPGQVTGFLRLEIQAKRLLELSTAYFNVVKASLVTKVKSPVTQKKLRDSLTIIYQNEITQFIDDYPDSIKALSKDYKEYLLSNAKISFGEDLFTALLSYASQDLRDRLLSMYFLEQVTRNNISVQIAQAFLRMKDVYCLNLLRQLSEKLSIGSDAYAFSLPDDSGKTVKLSDLKGKIVFVDFWFTGCTGCKQYYESVLHDLEKKLIKNPNINFVSVSIDIDKNRWLKSLKEGGYTGKEAINLFTGGKGFDHDVIRAFNVISYPRPILIDHNGKIVSMSYEELRDSAKLEELIVLALKKRELE